MLFLSIWDSLTLSISNAFRTFLLQICELLYLLMIFCYNAFEKLGNAEILTDSQVTAIYGRIGLILGLFMVFRIAFAGISYLINPDAMSDKKNGIGGIIKKIVISIVLLGITPSLFRTAYQVQRIIIRENIIAKIIVGGSSTSENAGNDLSKYLFLTFYTVNEEVDTTDTDAACPEYGIIENNFEKNFKYTYNCINLTSEVDDTNSKDGKNTAYTIKFDGILAVIVGILMLWTILTFTISAGIRVLKLAYLQMIAPIPIMAYVIPGGEETLKKWGKQCASTYADFFLRVAMIYFVAYLFEILSQTDTTIFKDSLGNTTPTEYRYLIITMIISMFYFIKKLPDLIKEIFPNFGGGDFSFKDSLGIIKGAATFGAGAVIGGIAGVATGIKHGEGFKGKLAGAFGGFGRGVTSTRTKGNIFKNAKNGINSTAAARQRAYEKNHDGSTFWGRNFAAGGAARTKDEFDREISANDAYVSTMKLIESETDKDARVITAQNNLTSISSKGRTTQAITVNGRTYSAGARIAASDLNDAISIAQKNVKKQRIACVEDVYNGTSTNGALVSLVNSAVTQVTKNASKGYDGFGNVTVTSGTRQVDYSASSTATSLDKAEGLFAYKATAAADTGNIKNTGGSKNEAYKKASANANYNKKSS